MARYNPSDFRGASKVFVSGHTYPHRDRLREAGGTWDAEAKRWELSFCDTMRGREQAALLVNSLNGCSIKITRTRS